MSCAAYRQVRNEWIVEQFLAGASQLELARKYGLTRRQIGNITRAAGIRMRERDRRHSNGGGKPLRLTAPDRRRYLYLRDQYGAVRARSEMGLAV